MPRAVKSNPSPGKLHGRKAIAEVLGVSIQRVSQYAAEGMPRTQRGQAYMYDEAECVQWVLENYPLDSIGGGTKPGAGRPKGSKNRNSAKPVVVPPTKPEVVPVADDGEEPAGDESYSELRRRNELEKLRLTRIERMQKEGQLVDVTEVRQEYTRKVSAAATHLRQAGRTLASDLCAKFAIPSDRSVELATMIENRLHAVSLQLATQRYGGRLNGGDDDASG